MARKDRQFWESARMNNATYLYYYNRLIELAVSRFKWKNLPDTIDERFLELTLLKNGQAVFFEDEALGFLALPNAMSGQFNVYGIPIGRRAYAVNGYNKTLNSDDSIIVWNNKLHKPSMYELEMFATRLYDLDRSIDVNAKAQKTPVLIKCDEKQRLTMKNLYMQYDGNQPFIFGDSNLNDKGVTVLNTQAPYVADKLYTLKTEIWNEALTYLGISNVNYQKKERMVTDEVNRSQGGTVASRFSPLDSRKQACEEINQMFGLDIDVDYQEGFDEDVENMESEVETDE